ncbi:MAG: hypothetical protein E5V64_06645 [Mesorhizobium sp.]|uniref:hypothetical protein n=1 Tax=Mesorhizobium sp. TaxID=1871066 RepID=UPI0012217E5B|nr:hypothetical protein [Mesorhizobium sp.]TIV83838.1 MAG: hypothetical protein E5V64_06645 [Mesorhizobium sp.]
MTATAFRKGDTVTIQGVIDSDWIHDGQIKVRVEPYHDFFAKITDLRMVLPVIDVGDTVQYPSEGYKAGTVLAVIDGYCWVKTYEGRASWPVSAVNRVDPSAIISAEVQPTPPPAPPAGEPAVADDDLPF